MKIFINLNELIKRLYAERKLLHALFQARLRFDFSYEEAVELVDNEKNLRLLIDNIESRIKNGSRKRYDEHYQKYSNLTTTDQKLHHLISLIHKYRRSYDQEGYILRNI